MVVFSDAVPALVVVFDGVAIVGLLVKNATVVIVVVGVVVIVGVAEVVIDVTVVVDGVVVVVGWFMSSC